VDQGETVSLRLIDSPAAAERMHHRGVRRLVVLQMRDVLANYVEQLPQLDQMMTYYAGLGAAAALRGQLVDLIADRAFLADTEPIRSPQAFEACLDRGWQRLAAVTDHVAAHVQRILESHHRAALALDEAQSNKAWPAATADVREQLAALVGDDFLAATPWPSLTHYPRYFEGVIHRLRKLAEGGLQRDREHQGQFTPLWQQYLTARAEFDRQGRVDSALEQYRWMLEEYRVSLFAQQLGTVIPVSPQRLAKQWALVGG